VAIAVPQRAPTAEMGHFAPWRVGLLSDQSLSKEQGLRKVRAKFGRMQRSMTCELKRPYSIVSSASEQPRWNFDAECFRSFEIDDEFRGHHLTRARPYRLVLGREVRRVGRTAWQSARDNKQEARFRHPSEHPNSRWLDSQVHQ
jgi:hypothetical protein